MEDGSGQTVGGEHRAPTRVDSIEAFRAALEAPRATQQQAVPRAAGAERPSGRPRAQARTALPLATVEPGDLVRASADQGRGWEVDPAECEDWFQRLPDEEKDRLRAAWRWEQGQPERDAEFARSRRNREVREAALWVGIPTMLASNGPVWLSLPAGLVLGALAGCSSFAGGGGFLARVGSATAALLVGVAGTSTHPAYAMPAFFLAPGLFMLYHYAVQLRVGLEARGAARSAPTVHVRTIDRRYEGLRRTVGAGSGPKAPASGSEAAGPLAAGAAARLPE